MAELIRMVSVDQIQDDRHQSRVVRDDEDFRDLVKSIREVGVLNPLVLVEELDHSLSVVAGHRRFAAAKAAGLAVVPCRVVAGSIDLIDRIRFDENKHREDLTATEEGRLFMRMLGEGRMKISEVAKAVGQSESYVQVRLSLLETDTEIIEAVDARRISMSVARELAGISNRGRRLYFLRFCLDGGATSRTVAKWRADCEAEEVADMNRRELIEKAGRDPQEPGVFEAQQAIGVLPATGRADEYGWFTCACNRRAQVSGARYINGEWTCGDCVAVMRAEQESALRGPCCPGCGNEVPSARRRLISLCQGCYDVIQSAMERAEVQEGGDGSHEGAEQSVGG